MKKISLILILIILIFSFSLVISAQDNDEQDSDEEEIYIVETSIKIYDQPRRFSNVFVLQTGTILYLDPYYEDESFFKVFIEESEEDVEEGYVMIEDLFGDNVSSTTSADLSDGDDSTASARGSMGQKRVLSLGSLKYEEIGDISSVNKMERMTSMIGLDIWEEFRKFGRLGEFFQTPSLY
jgi:hypothetical protein